MPHVVSTPSRIRDVKAPRSSRLGIKFRLEAPSFTQCGCAILSAVLLIISFPDSNLWPLAWVALVPLCLALGQPLRAWSTFILGWIFGTIFFYGTCYWLTYSMIHTGGISPWFAFPLLFPGAVLVGIFPGVFALVLSRLIRKWGPVLLFVAPFLWCALEWVRLETTGQLWNAIGYSQAYQPALIQAARWGGVYAVGFLILAANASLTFIVLKRNARSFLIGAGIILAIVGTLFLSSKGSTELLATNVRTDATVVAIQPNVPMDLVKSVEDMRMLSARHFEMSKTALARLPTDGKPRLVIWPESPMNFTYGSDQQLRELLGDFAKANDASVLLNSQEVAPNDGVYNSALLINQDGRVVAQYDKIRLLPFGEYVPLPHWLPGAGLITGIVGDFTPGTNYGLMPVGTVRAGVFICIESAYPSIARRFTAEGADVLINISNDGYLGPTAVMRQHLANAVFRAVENDRPLLRVTNTGISALITPRGVVTDATQGFRQDVRVWSMTHSERARTFYTKHGDWFAVGCAIFSLLLLGLSFRRTAKEPN